MPTTATTTTTSLEMAKKIKNKQLELAKKLALAKKQNAEKQQNTELPSSSSSSSAMKEKLSDEEIKEQNDRLRFEELLRKQSASLNSLSSDGYLNKEQEEAEIDAYQRGVERLFEGDPAPTQPFEELVSIKSENAIGETGTKRLIPWLKNNNLSSEFLIIVCDPRVQSPELRDTVKKLSAELSPNLLKNLIFINPDTPAENRRWLKKANLLQPQDSNIHVFSDEKREWMRSYTALGEERWRMSMFIIADERIQKVAREMELMYTTQVIENAVKAMKTQRL